MKLTITHKGTTVMVEDIKLLNINDIITDTIKQINASCNNCTLEKQGEYGNQPTVDNTTTAPKNRQL